MNGSLLHYTLMSGNCIIVVGTCIRGNNTLLKIHADPVIFGGVVGGFYEFTNTSYLIYCRKYHNISKRRIMSHRSSRNVVEILFMYRIIQPTKSERVTNITKG
jgi:hypothetical protein